MKHLVFSLIFLVLLFVGHASALKVVEGILSSEEIEKVRETTVRGKSPHGETDFFVLPRSLVERLHGGTPSCFSEEEPHHVGGGGGIPVQARSIHRTTYIHQDHHWESGSAIVDDEVAFVFLNSNPDAKFIHNGTQVEVRAGSMVQFSGHVPHNTVISSGSVLLAGPFHLNSMKPVGGGCNFSPVGTAGAGKCLDDNSQEYKSCEWTEGGVNFFFCDGDFACVGYSDGPNSLLFHYQDGTGPTNNDACPSASASNSTFIAGNGGSGCPAGTSDDAGYTCYKKDCNGQCGAGGDPHYMLFGGKRYNYQGECDLVLVSTKTFQGGQNLDVHVRTKIESVYSVITAIAIMVGTLVFEFNHETVGAPKYLVNGQPVELPFEQDQFKVTTHELYNEDFNKMIQMITVVIGIDATLHISIMDQWVHVNMDARNIFDSVGLAGSFPKGEMLGRDGTDLSHDRNAFGSQWQVQPEEPQLFHSMPDGHPQSPQATCKLPAEDAHQYLRTRNSELYNMAVEACKKEGISGLDLEDCVFDVSVMNNPKIAAAWWAMEKEE